MFKRLFDFLVAVVALLILSPVLLLIALLIKLTSRGTVLYIDTRVGQHGQQFAMYKFRTMVQSADQIGLGRAVAVRDPRITRIGRWLRTWSLDELPQLLNVLRGEMSIVGPRPTIPAQVALYSEHERQRLATKPGLTGWAQVNGRNNISWEQRIELDIWYVAHQSFTLDLKIILRTIKVLIRREGLYGVDGITPSFKGE